MKLNKTQLKKILKEVVRELVDEGAFDNVIKESVSPRANVARRPAANDFAASYGQRSEPMSNDHSERQQDSLRGQGSKNTRLQELTRRAAAEASGGDPQQAKMMEAIFADTAASTLQRQLGYESHGSAGLYSGEPDPEQERQDMAALDVLSGGKGAQHWAALAFGKYNQ